MKQADEIMPAIAHIRTPDQRVRVFISSTIKELEDERHAARRAVLDLKLHPVMFEAGARPYTPRDVYTAYLLQSHIYIGIFWESYGWVAPESEISGIEDEYNLSSTIGMPRLVYIKDTARSRDKKLEKLLNRIQNDGTICYRTFSKKDKLVELIQNDIMLLLSERFGLETIPLGAHIPPRSHLEDVKDEMRKSGILLREELVSEIKSAISEHHLVSIIGEPGIGKTYILGLLTDDLEGIYVSLRNKSLQQVCSNLANHLRIRRDQIPQSFPTEDNALEALQVELANASAMLGIDHLDQNPEAAETLLTLDFYNSTLVVASREQYPILEDRTAIIEIPPLTSEELNSYLELQTVELTPGEFTRLNSASNGNPLYLYYFSQFQISPLPQGLSEFQRVLWNRLSADKQESLSFLALSISPLNISELHTLINYQSNTTKNIQETRTLIESLTPLVRSESGRYEIFHPLFKESIQTSIDEASLSNYYHSQLADLAIDNNQTLASAYHLLRANDPRTPEYLAAGAVAALLRGDLLLAVEFLQNIINSCESSGASFELAHAKYLLAEALLGIGRHNESRAQAESSIAIFKEIGELEWVELVELWASLLLIEEGKTDQTISILNKALSKYRTQDSFMEAVTELNLSYAYIQVSKFRKGAESAEHALDLFTELEDERGIQVSLINLAGCLGNLGEVDVQEKHTDTIISIAREKNLPRLLIAGLNNKAIVERKQGNLQGAFNTLKECIQLCQNLGSIELEAQNIANLGNVYLDQQKLTDSESAYRESLHLSRENNLVRSEANALQLLARLKQKTNLHSEAIELAKEAVNIHLIFGDMYRIAYTQFILADSQLQEGQKEDAAINFENSGDYYAEIEYFDEASFVYQEAGSIWLSLGLDQKASTCIAKGVEVSLLDSDPSMAAQILSQLPGENGNNKYGEVYYRILKELIRTNSDKPFVLFMNNFASYCKNRHLPTEKAYYRLGVDHLLENVSDSTNPNVLTALGGAIEQASQDIFPLSDLDEIASQLADRLEHFHYRVLPDGVKILTFCLPWAKPIILQVVCFSDNGIVLRIALAISLILMSMSPTFEDAVKGLGGNKEDSLAFHLMTEKDFEEHIGNLTLGDTSEPVSATFTESNVPWDQTQPPNAIIIHDDYQLEADWSKNPGNKEFVWITMNVYAALVSHCVHKKRDEISDLAKSSREFCEKITL